MEMTTEASNPDSVDLDRLDTLELVQLINAEDAKVAAAVGEAATPIAAAIDVIAARLASGGRLIYVGAGTSGRLGVLDAAECPPTFNADPEQVIGLIAGGPSALTNAVEGAEDSPELAIEDLQAIDLSEKDAVVGIAASGQTPYVLAALDHARSIGAAAIGFACNQGAAIEEHADIMITVVAGPEVLAGSTRMKAGTATKMVLNMLTTGAMVRLGKTYGNLMVDLQATNAKLVTRTVGILQKLSGLTATDAEALLQSCDGELKTAIVCNKLDLSPDAARTKLDAASGRLRLALDENTHE
jgi:N-acetylmuramic acid 6-phosphate etherase